MALIMRNKMDNHSVLVSGLINLNLAVAFGTPLYSETPQFHRVSYWNPLPFTLDSHLAAKLEHFIVGAHAETL